MLTGEQRAELIQLRQLFLNKQAGISKQRADALHYLSQAFKVQPGLAGERAASSAYLKVSTVSSPDIARTAEQSYQQQLISEMWKAAAYCTHKLILRVRSPARKCYQLKE